MTLEEYRDRSELELLFEALLKRTNIPYVREYPVLKEDPKRKGRSYLIDFAVVDKKIGFEVDGGMWIKGRHLTPTGFMKDARKYVRAAQLGWYLFHIPGEWLKGTRITSKNKDYMMDYNELKDFVTLVCK